MSGNHVLRIFSAAPTHFRSQFSREFSARPQARVFKHHALRLEACEERNLLAATAVISAVVFGNENNDGTQDGSEIGIDGVTLSLSGTNDLGTITPISAVTDSNGVNRFTSLRPGNYSVTDDFPAGYLEGLKAKNDAVIPASNATDTIDGITLADDQTASGNTFGEIPAVTIAGTVFADANNDGLQQGTELGLADVNISLVTSIFDLTPLATTTTLSDGSYSFGSLRPGTYAIVENDVTGFLHGQNSLNNVANSESNGTGFIEEIMADTAGVDGGNNFAELVPGNISGIVFADGNNNGSQDNGENGIGNVTLTLTGTDDLSESVSQTATTASDGTYSFGDLRAGTYSVAAGTSPGFADGKNALGGTLVPASFGTNQLAPIVASFGGTASANTFGELAEATISGAVYVDANNNGTKDTGEAGIAGVTLTLS